jgi:hypothetical protein
MGLIGAMKRKQIHWVVVAGFTAPSNPAGLQARALTTATLRRSINALGPCADSARTRIPSKTLMTAFRGNEDEVV